MLSRKWWTRLIIAMVLTLIVSITGTIVEWHVTRSRGEALRDAAVAQLDADEPNWRAADLTTARNATLPPADRNATEIALAANGKIPQSFHKWLVPKGDRPDLPIGVLWHEDDLRDAKAEIAECAEALSLARTLQNVPQGGWKLVFKEPNPIETIVQKTQEMRTVAALLMTDVSLLAHAGKPDAAMRSVLAILNCGRGGVGDEPTMISQLVRIAVTTIAAKMAERTLGWGEPSNAELTRLQLAFAEELASPRLVHGLRGDRAMFYLIAENMDNGTLSSRDLGTPELEARFTDWIYSKYLPKQQAVGIEILNQYIAAAKLTGRERRDAIADIKVPEPTRDMALVGLLMPSIERVIQADTRMQAQLASAVVALACERYRRQFHKWPEALEAIPKDILPTLPVDPYTGTALLYAKFDDGVAVYTTGADLLDNGGKDFDPKNAVGSDLGFRLFNPDQRRRQPPAKAIEPIDPPNNPGERFVPPADKR